MRKFFPDFDRPIVAPDTTSCRSAYFRGRGYPIGPGYKPHVSTPPGLREFPSAPEHPPEWADPAAPYTRHPNAPKPFRRGGKPSVPLVRPGQRPVVLPRGRSFLPVLRQLLPNLQDMLANELNDAIAGGFAVPAGEFYYGGSGTFYECQFPTKPWGDPKFTEKDFYSDASGTTAPDLCGRIRSDAFMYQVIDPAWTDFANYWHYDDGWHTGSGYYSRWWIRGRNVGDTALPQPGPYVVPPRLVPRPDMPVAPFPWLDPLISPGVEPLAVPPPVWAVPVRPIGEAVPGHEASSAGNAPPSSGGGTVPAVPEPDRPVSPLPSRPPLGTTEKKRTNPLIPVLFKVWDAATEAQDAVDAVFGALPKPVRDDYHGRGLVDKAGYVFDHIDDVDIPEAIGNLIRNEIEDRAVGKMLGIADKAGVGPGLSGVGHLKR